MGKCALVTGITGQDAAYLSELLIDKGYEVWGAHRPASTLNTWRLEELNVLNSVNLIPLELLEYENIKRVVDKVQPDEVYNLAAQSFVSDSFKQPLYTSNVNALGVNRLLEALRGSGCKFYQASTSEMFGNVEDEPQNEQTRFEPESPYAVSKLHAHWATLNYRKAYELETTCGILFNHESPLRGQQFVTRKITSALAGIKSGNGQVLSLGNLSAKRDWGYADDYVKAMWQMVNHSPSSEYVIATGESHSVKEFVSLAAEVLDLKLQWEGEGKEATGYSRALERTIVDVDEKFFRPADVINLRGDSSRARSDFGWEPEVSFEELVRKMIKADVDRIETGS